MGRYVPPWMRLLKLKSSNLMECYMGERRKVCEGRRGESDLLPCRDGCSTPKMSKGRRFLISFFFYLCLIILFSSVNRVI